jgi:hypothetical protein
MSVFYQLRRSKTSPASPAAAASQTVELIDVKGKGPAVEEHEDAELSTKVSRGMLLAKGAPESLLKLCTRIMRQSGTRAVHTREPGEDRERGH